MVSLCHHPLIAAPARKSAKLDGEHGDRTAVNTLDRETYLLLFPAKSQHVEQRLVMVGRRHREQGVRAESFVIDNRGIVPAEQQFPHPQLETLSPVKGLHPFFPPGVG